MSRRNPLLVLVLLLACLQAGCAVGGGPDRLQVAPADYHRAFDAAVAAAAAEGLPAALRDRRGGIIETEARIAPSMVEPWRGDATSPDARVESTVALQRRRVRFEFTTRADDAPDPPDGGDQTGPDVLGLAGAGDDRTQASGPLDLTVSVWVERAHQPGIRRNTWTRQATTRMRIVKEADGTPVPSTFWTPVARDRGFERRLLANVEQALAEPETTATASPF